MSEEEAYVANELAARGVCSEAIAWELNEMKTGSTSGMMDVTCNILTSDEYRDRFGSFFSK